MDKKVRFLHVCRDDKFLKGTVRAFTYNNDSISSEFIILKPKKQKLKFVDENVLEVFTSRKVFKAKLRNGDYDAVYFHSLPPENYWMINSIPKDKIVIWWSWGYDVYNGGIYGWKSLINVESVKTETKKIQNQSRSLVRRVALFFCMLYYEVYGYLTRDSVLKRIDFFRPVLPVEYEIMKRNKNFKAREYYPLHYALKYQMTSEPPKANGSIIIGNSAAAFNNHADVWKDIRCYLPEDRNVIIPLSYGTVRYAKKIKAVITGKNVQYLDDFLPKDEYFNIMNNCSYAVYGSMRQHAMGNILHALAEGMKVFLYKDSFVYDSLKAMGFVVYTIEGIDSNSFSSSLSKEDLEKNAQAFDRWRDHCSTVKTEAMKQIEKKLYR